MTTTPDRPRDVAASVLLNTYGHLQVPVLIIGGMPPREASPAACELYYTRLLVAFLRNMPTVASRSEFEQARRVMYPAGQGSQPGHHRDPFADTPETGPHKHWTSRCYVAAVDDDRKLLRTSWTDLVRRYGPMARARIGAAHLAALDWQLDMMRLMATGAGDLPHCARVAHDRHLRKPARRRQPADPAWLYRQLSASLNACWDALAHADNGRGAPFWTFCAPDLYGRGWEGR